MQKFKLAIYYLIIQYLPHSRLLYFSNIIRLWYVSKVLKIGPFDKSSKFESKIYISDAKNITIGSCVRINENVFLQGSIAIGNNVLIAPNVSIYSKTHEMKDANVSIILQGDTEVKPVIIENNVWLGINSVILPGITIGEGSIVGANSVVTKNVEPYTIVGGVPAKLIRKRN